MSKAERYLQDRGFLPPAKESDPGHELPWDAVIGGKGSKKPEEKAWPEPEPLESPLPPVEKLPVSYLPEPFQAWLKDMAWRMQCPLDFVAVGAIVTTGSIIGAGCGIKPKQHDDWLVVPNLWGGIIARPSQLKTPSLKETMTPIDRLEAEAREKYEEELKFAEADKEILKAQKEAIKREMGKAARKTTTPGLKNLDDLRAEYASLEEPETPIRRRYKTNDATIEMLGVLLNNNPRGILIFRDELIGLLVSWEKAGHETDRAFYLEAWDGTGSFTTDRIGRGTIDTQNLCISILGGIQPAKLAAYLAQAKDPLQNDGMIQRFQLLVYPDEPAWRLIDEAPDLDARTRAYEVYNALAEMDFTEYGATPGKKRPYFVFSEEAQKSFNAWLTQLQSVKLKDETPLIAEHLAKYRSLMPSLALIFHLIDCADGKTSGPVSDEAALRAMAWCQYLESHARRIYSFVADADEQAAVELAKRIKKKDIEDGFTLRDIYRNCWSLLNTKEDVEAACNVLIEAGWLKEQIPAKGKTRKLYHINPKIYTNP
jgi:hypothetical protein